MAKIALIFPPTYSPFCISAILPAISGIIKSNNIEIETFDFNIQFFKMLFKKSYLEKSFLSAVQFINDNKQNYDNLDDFNREKFRFISDYLKKNKKHLPLLLKNIEPCIETCTKMNKFLNPLEFLKANFLLTKSLSFLSLPFYPLIIDEVFSLNSEYILETDNFDKLKFFLDNPELNLFSEFIDEHLETLLKEDYAYIGITVSSYSQFLFSLALAKKLKERKNVKIALGGQNITHMYQKLFDNKFLFEYVDGFLYGDGEKSLIDFYKYSQNEIDIHEVSNLIFLENGEVRVNEIHYSDSDELPTYDYDCLNLKDYFLPTPVISIQTSKSCYWGQCAFCNFMHGSKYSQRPVEDVIKEIEYNYKKHGVKHIFFSDACLEPQFLLSLAKEIIKRKLKIYYFAHLRAEKQFTKENLKLLYHSGLRYASVGFETCSQKLLNLYKKGTQASYYKEFIDNVRKANIFLVGNFIFGFFNETPEDTEMTLDFIRKNYKKIDIIHSNPVILLEHSDMNINKEKYGIKDEDLVKGFYSSSFKKNVERKEEINRLVTSATQYSNSFKYIFTPSISHRLIYLGVFAQRGYEILCNMMQNINKARLFMKKFKSKK